MKQMVFAILFALLSLSDATAQKGRPLEIRDLFAMKRVAAPIISPDGLSVAYSRTTVDRGKNTLRSDIWLSSLDGSSSRPLTSHPSADRNPAWSPDGRSIVFESTRSGESQIWGLDLEGGEPRQLTTLSTGAHSAVWSPDGSLLAFVSEVFPEYSASPCTVSDSLNRTRLSGMGNANVTARVYTRLLARHWDRWSDGRRAHLFLQPVSGGEPRDITPGDRDAIPTSSTFSAGIDFAFSPDGKEIAYTATPFPPQNEAWSTNYDIFIVPTGGGRARQLTTNAAADGYPRYSPDGKYLAYRAQSRPGDEADRWQLMLYDRVAGTTRSLTANFDASVDAPVWAPDSRMLFFTAEDQAETSIFIVTVQGNDVRRVFGPGTNHDILASRDGTRLVFTHATAVRPAEIMTCRTDGGRPALVTHANDDLFRELDISSPQKIWYRGEGGTPIQAWLYRPPGFDSTRTYPLVMLVHGGPQGSWGDSWSYRWNPPLWAAQGYVILAPNPRGSTGFGQKFVDEISHDWGGRVFVDLVRGLDTAQSLPYVDRARTAAAGASFGGYMMNWFQARIPERFRTLITHSGEFNATSTYGSTDELWFDEWEHGIPWEDPESFERFSPHRYAKNFNTPMLILHGELDFRVPLTEGLQMFTALQRKGIPSKLVTFPDENHWILKPANSEFWHTTVFEWLASYLRP